VQTTERSEVVLNLRVKLATADQRLSVLVEGSEADSQIRFHDLQALVRYLQALSNTHPVKGLR
jgi:hypothetical protein